MSQKTNRLMALWNLIQECRKCQISALARNKVFGDGNVSSKVMLVGEGPGMDEDLAGHPFVGKAGHLLTSILQAAGIDRDKIFISNVMKCHPCKDPQTGAGNRKPTSEEMMTCRPWLVEQILVVRPRAILALGGTAIEGLTAAKPSMPVLDMFGDSMPLVIDNGRERFETTMVAVCHPQFLGYNENNQGRVRAHGFEMSYPELRGEYVEVFRRVWLWAHQ